MEERTSNQDLFPKKDKVIHRIKEEDRKSKKKFALIGIVSGIGGGILGGFLVVFAKLLDSTGLTIYDLWQLIQVDFVVSFRYLLIVVGILGNLTAWLLFRKAKKLWEDKEHLDDNWDLIDAKIEESLVVVTVMNVVLSTFFGAGMYMLERTLDGHFVTYLLSLPGFLCSIFIGLALTKKNVNMQKEMNPEKRGSVYDMQFRKKWYQSCDEAEKKQIGIAAYKAYTATMYCCLILIAVLSVLGMVFDFGLLPIFCVGIVWLTQTIAYLAGAKKAKHMIDND